MKISKLFSLAALALMTAACSEQIEQVQQPRTTEGIPFTATIGTEGHAATRALAESGTSITATWATGEKVALIYTVGTTTYLKEATVTPQTDGTATISTTLEGNPEDDTDVTIVYPASAVDGTTKDVKTDLLTSQNGLLTGTGSISEKYDLRKTSTPAKLKIDGTTASLKGTVTLAQQISIWKLTLQSGGSSLSAKALAVKDASDNLLASATLATAGSEFYVAVPAMTSAKIIAVNGANSYSYSKASVSISAGKYYQSTVSLTEDEYTDLSALESANTYMVTAVGKYKFNATVKGNGGFDPLTGTTATTISGITGVNVLWELYSQGRAIKHGGTAYEISYADGYVYFSTPDEFTSGDCYVAVHDSEGTILWSWLIWATPEPGTTTHNEKTFMDRNLGAIDVGNCMRGFLYQWSRKDPFSAANGNSYSYYTFVPAASSTFGTLVSSTQSMLYTVQNPTVRTTEYPWMLDDERVKSPWRDDVKTIYDPCPGGWRVPTKTDMANFTSLPATGMYDPGTGSGYNYFGNPDLGYYQTSTIGTTDKTKNWAFCNDNRLEEWGQTSGRAIRPVRDLP